jgi:hypothetical protein
MRKPFRPNNKEQSKALNKIDVFCLSYVAIDRDETIGRELHQGSNACPCDSADVPLWVPIKRTPEAHMVVSRLAYGGDAKCTCPILKPQEYITANAGPDVNLTSRTNVLLGVPGHIVRLTTSPRGPRVDAQMKDSNIGHRSLPSRPR